MTAFARVENQAEWGTLVCEIRSINHRYLETSLYLPEVLRAFEMPIRENIKQQVKRGKLECAFRYQPNVATKNKLFSVNESLAKELVMASESIGRLMIEPPMISVTDILRYPGVIESKDNDLTQIKETMLELLEKALQELIVVRQREGKDLEQLFLTRMQLMQDELAKVKQRLPNLLQEARERLLKRFKDVQLEMDSNRLEQEMVIFAQRIDVSEEIERLETHIAEVRRVLKQGGLVGRRLDFLMQELNREANTLGSKSVDSVVTYAAVEMKVLIEQVREQVQNVE